MDIESIACINAIHCFNPPRGAAVPIWRASTGNDSKELKRVERGAMQNKCTLYKLI